jgi:hypothetical protein
MVAAGLDVASVAVTCALGLAVVLDVSGSPRVLLALAFTVYVPGRAIVANWPTARARSEFALPIPLSLSVVTGVAVLSLWLRAWNPEAAFAVVGGASVVALLWAIRHRSFEPIESRRRRGWPR